MQPALSRATVLAAALLLSAAAPACVDAARVDALEANVARIRAESAQRALQQEQQLGWLRWGQIVLARDVYGQAADHDVLVRKLAVLEAENAELTARLERAEQRRDAPRAMPADALGLRPGLRADEPPYAPGPARVLDETIPYDVGSFVPAVAKKTEKRPAPPARVPSAHARRLDEAVPYAAPASEAKIFPRVLDETVPY
jgi:hypothetical protein